jgi:phosphotransferase system IIB component
MDIKKLAIDIYNLLCKYNVVETTHCLTRLRIKFDGDIPSRDDVLAITGVVGLVTRGQELQIILGPNIVDQVYSEIKKIQGSDSKLNVTTTSNIKQQVTNFDDVKKKYRKNIVSQTLSSFAKIFSPLIPAFVGAGIVAGAANLISAFTPVSGNITN